MNFTINQTKSSQEIVNSALLSKLYNLFITNGNSHTINLLGNLYSSTGYKALIDSLTQTYPDLIITVPLEGLYILFEDPNVEAILQANNIGDGVGITILSASNAILTSSMFQNNTDITSFPEFIYFTKANTNPPTSLFAGCSMLQSIDLSEVTKVSQSEFAGSGLSGDISIPNLQSVGLSAFQNTSISTVSNLGSIESMSRSMFYDCPNLTSVVVPLTVTLIQNGAMSAYNKYYTKVLTTVTGLDNVTSYQSSVFNNQSELSLDITNLNKIQSLGDTVFDNCLKVYGILNLPNLSNVSNTPGATFRKTAITKVQCLGKLTSIVDNMFYQNSNGNNSNKLKEVYIPYECVQIGAGAFLNCVGLTTIKQYTNSVDNWIEGETPTYINISRVTTFGLNCFNGCNSLSLTNADITNAVTIGNNAFNGCNISGNLSLPNLTTVGENAFYGCNLGTVTLPNISSLTHRSFNNCGVTSFDISGSSITNIAFLNLVTGDQLTSVKLPTTVTTFGSTYGQTFYSKNITELRGVLGITTVYASNPNNILNPLPLLSLLTSDKFILAMDMSNGLVFTASCPQVYLPVFKYCTKTTIAKAPYNGYRNPESTFFLKYTNLKMPIRLLYFKDLEYIRPFMFYGTNVTSLVINNTTCPTFNTNDMTYTNLLDTQMSDFTDWSTKPFGNMSTATMTIYVPNNVVSTYQADSNYNSYTILGIGLLNSGVIYATEDDWVEANKPDGLIAEYLGLSTIDLAAFVSANNLTYWTNPNS